MRLQGKLLRAIVPTTALSLIVLGWVAYTLLKQNSEVEYLRAMDLLLDQSQQQIESYLGTTLANVKLFSNSNLIQRYVQVEDENDRYDIIQPALIKLFSSYRESYPDYLEIRLLFPDGYEDTRLAVTSMHNATEEEGQTDWFREMALSGTNAYVRLGNSVDDGETRLLVGRPILLPDRKKDAASASLLLHGYLVVTASLDFLSDWVRHYRIGKEGYLMITDHEGKILYHKDANMLNTQSSTFARLLKKQSSTDSTEYIKHSGEQILVRSKWLDEGLVFVAVLPKSELTGAGRKIALAVAAVTMVGILLTTVLFYLSLRSTVLRPILRLRETAVAIGNGQLDREIDVSGKDEISDLASAFREMNQKLGASMNEIQTSHAQIERLAYRDSLTGLPNRRLFMNYVEQAVALAKRNNTVLGILFLDLDDFKRVNDTLGHDCGDTLLQLVSKRLQNCVRESDKVTLASDDKAAQANPVARLGGDEFIIMLTNLHRADSVTQVAERIISVLAEPINLNGREFVVGTSIGISLFPADATEVGALIKCADTAMYAAKHQQKNTYRFYGDSMQSDLELKIEMEDNLRLALKRDELSIQYQPQYSTRTGRIVGVEALVRWCHEEQGMIPPDAFISVAEDTGLIVPLGKWVMMESCRQWSEWQDSAIAPQRIGVNVSQRQFALSDVSELVANALETYSLKPEVLEIELTESCMMESDSVVDTLFELQNKGIRIAMDDFGTGYSSLAVLTSLPIDTLKIDRSFITGIVADSPNEKVVSAILMLAKSLNLEVVAEGVEEEGELDYLREHNCDLAQGYLLSKPLPVSEMTQLLRTELGADQVDLAS